jgi:hypothetical protein
MDMSKTVEVSDTTWHRLMQDKIDSDAPSLDFVIADYIATVDEVRNGARMKSKSS